MSPLALAFSLVAAVSASDEPPVARRFVPCPRGGGINCVVDGDTFWIDGRKVRIADIDTPETHPPRCAEEARRGNAATLRLTDLLSDGEFVLRRVGRDTDRYGRTLRIVMRGGESIGDTLVREGLARPYTGGRRDSWCDSAAGRDREFDRYRRVN